MAKLGLIGLVVAAVCTGGVLYTKSSEAKSPEAAMAEEGWKSVRCVPSGGATLCDVNGLYGGRWRCSDPWFADSVCIPE